MSENFDQNLPNGSNQNQPPSLFRRVLKGAAWTFGGHIVGQAIRFGNNLILSRLLFPEAFGLMGIVYTFIVGLTLFSDTGTNPNIIQSKRGEDQTFLNTAWTVDCIRGMILWVCACLISVPVANFYKEPILQYLLPASALTTLISGFNSNKLVLANRKLHLGRLTAIDLTTQITGIVVTLIGAWIAKSTGAERDVAVWALVVGNLASSICHLVLSYIAIEGEGNWFLLDRQSLRELFQFGRWVFLSTILTFFASQGNNLVIPRLLGVAFFGIYSFAYNLSQLASLILSMLGGRVLFPSFAELHRDRPERLYPALKRARIVLNAVNWGISLFFIFFGQQLIQLMYDDRYSEAGWMLQLLALGSLVTVVGNTYADVLLAQGKTFILTMMSVFQAAFQFTALFLGYHLGGNYGLVLGTALVSWLLYPIQAIFYVRLSIWQPEVDLPIIGVATLVAAYVLIY